MDKTININISGTLFKIDEDAYIILRDYLQAINNRFRNTQGGPETVEDIESRIAEIFQSRKGQAGVITKVCVEEMIATIGKPEDFDQNETVTGTPVYTSQAKKMYRNPDDSIISGVCGGIGIYLNTEPVLFRILFVLFTVFFGIGFFIYIALWIALPAARTDIQKREMYGDAYNTYKSRARQSDVYTASERNSSSGIGNAFNEIFRALGKVCFIILRIFLIFIGITLVFTGFAVIVSFFMLFVFKYPGAISTGTFSQDLIYFPDLLNYIVNPSVVPWIIALSIIAILLPTIAVIYWGVKMIFWFRAKDGLLSLICFVIWVASVSALSMILFHEGISFAQTSRSSSQIFMSDTPDTLHVISGNKASDLKFDKEISFDNETHAIYINDGSKELYLRPNLYVNSSDDDAKVEVRKRSSGHNRLDAKRKTEELQYNYSLKNDTLTLDDYFTIPSGRRWSADDVHINLNIPDGTVLEFDKNTAIICHSFCFYDDETDSDYASDESENKWWILKNGKLRPAKNINAKQK
ncbi:MAG TPA: PspC domain-containing protein [Bacteroidales bacterium]|nr:PspC domain-containing protein [Bacteroidales bacterium]